MRVPSKDISNRAHRPNYRDELNFAEFPLASLSTVLPKGQNTLEFSDEIFDKSINKPIQRKLTITASDKYGLPTATDEEVILGLIQLSARTDFHDRRVYFTRYELLKLLGWADSTRNYQRLEQSLNRWLGVTLYYDKAWWSKEDQSWVNEGFHILDHVQVLDQERQRRSLAKETPQAGKSSFVWNEVVFGSFKAGYIKQLDFEFLKSLKSAISRRMFRFLDKRFYQRQRLEYDLRNFACEHLGLSKKCHNGELKRVLRPALKELEERGFLQPMDDAGRFVQEVRGAWTIVLIVAGKAPLVERKPDTPLVQVLKDRGLQEASARRLAEKRDAKCIQEKIALVDWLIARKDIRVSKNVAGFLYSAIDQDYPLPDDYVATKKAVNRPRSALAVPETRRAPEPPSRSRHGIDEYWNALNPDEQVRLEKELVSKAQPFLRQQYVEGQESRGLLFLTVRQAMIDDFVRAELDRNQSAASSSYSTP